MTIIEIFRLVIGTIFLALGLMVFFIEIIGIYKMKYVLNRLHSAAMGDTMGIFLCILGLCFYSGINFTTAKLIFALRGISYVFPFCLHSCSVSLMFFSSSS